MALPNPLPDNPLRWDGWKNYNSDNYYDRLCLSSDSNATADQIEENCRLLLVWWQKKLPLKNQPSNPLTQLLRAGLDEAPAYLVAARTELLNSDARARLDAQIHARAVAAALQEFKKLLAFALVNKTLLPEAEERLHDSAASFGLSRAETMDAIETELARLGAVRVDAPVVAEAAPPPRPAELAPAKDAFGEFRRMLRLSKLSLDGEEMTDDQRDALCNMGESLGLTGGQAEDLIDEYLEEVSGGVTPPIAPKLPRVVAAPQKAVVKALATGSANSASATPIVRPAPINVSPLARAEEKLKYPNYVASIGLEMLLISSGSFRMGSTAPDAAAHEQPVSAVTLRCFYLSRYPVTNAEYEQFDATHRSKRPSWADDRHPVVYVSSGDAEKFCQWLSSREGRKYRLPTEAEWEYAARGAEGRTFPWGETFDAGHYANFADQRTAFPWRDPNLDDGYPETSPVGAYPRGASPFGIEDLAGNVFEWCLDFYEPYKGKDVVNRRGSLHGTKRIYRGGSWKSRTTSLRASARHFNMPDYSSNDVGFRVVCECD